MSNLNIHLKSAERTSLTRVKVTYERDGIDFSVFWNCSETAHGKNFSVDWEAKKAEKANKLSTFQLELNVESKDKELLKKVSTAIRLGKKELNPDIGLFTYVKNEFTALDCMVIEIDSSKIKLEQFGQVELMPWVVYGADAVGTRESLAWAVNYPINGLFVLNFDYRDGFSIPASVEVNCGNRCVQDCAKFAISARELAKELKLPTSIPELFKKYQPMFICGDHYEELMIQKVIADAEMVYLQ